MAVTCHVRIVSEEGTTNPSESWARPLIFEEKPGLGEFVSFSRDGRRDPNGVLHMETFRVKLVMHTVGNDRAPPMILLDVVAIHRPSQT